MISNGTLRSRAFSISIVLIIFRWCSITKEMPGAAQLKTKNIQNNCDLMALGKLNIVLAEYFIGSASQYKLINKPYTGINSGKKTHDSMCEATLIF